MHETSEAQLKLMCASPVGFWAFLTLILAISLLPDSASLLCRFKHAVFSPGLLVNWPE